MSEQKFYQCDKPQGSTFGVSSGVGGGFCAGPNPPSMCKEERDALHASGAPRPNGFTGVWGGVHYYKGQLWAGPTNTMGMGKLQAVCLASSTWAVRSRPGEERA